MVESRGIEPRLAVIGPRPCYHYIKTPWWTLLEAIQVFCHVHLVGNVPHTLKAHVDAPPGFEPRYSAPKADVLPLDEGAI
jgi:hypothetical protein